MDTRNLLTYPTWERYVILSHIIAILQVRDRRLIFQVVRKYVEPDENMFFPKYGFTLSEFAVWHILGDSRRKMRKGDAKIKKKSK